MCKMKEDIYINKQTNKSKMVLTMNETDENTP